MRKVIRGGNLGDLNILPFAVQIINNTGWLLYGCQIKNLFVFLSNGPGTLLALYFAFHSFKLAPQADGEKFIYLLIG
jgi:hypothetical protein